MKRRLCLKKNCHTGKFEETTLFTAGEERKKIIYIYIYMRRGPLLKKAREGKERREEERIETSLHSHINHRNISYVQGAKC